MVETGSGEFSKICKKDWKPDDKNPSVFSHLEKDEGKKDCWEFLIVGDKEVTYQTDKEIIKRNIEKVKKLKSFKKFAEKNSIKIED
jgi:hypothetical protein